MALRSHLPTNTPYFDIGMHQWDQQPCLTWWSNAGKTIRIPLLRKYFQTFSTENKPRRSISAQNISGLSHRKQLRNCLTCTKNMSPQLKDSNYFPMSWTSTGIATRQLSLTKSSVALPEPGQTPYKRHRASLINAMQRTASDRQVYLLIPKPLLNVVRPLLQKYIHNIKNAKLHNDLSTRGSFSDRPDEIYVPTKSVQRNADFYVPCHQHKSGKMQHPLYSKWNNPNPAWHQYRQITPKKSTSILKTQRTKAHHLEQQHKPLWTHRPPQKTHLSTDKTQQWATVEHQMRPHSYDPSMTTQQQQCSTRIPAPH